MIVNTDHIGRILETNDMKPCPRTPAAMSGLQHTLHKGFSLTAYALKTLKIYLCFLNIDNQHFIQNLGLSTKAGDIL